jgi:hypothetical protein
VNEVMAQYFQEPYPARAAIGVAALPKGAAVEMDAIMAVAARAGKKSQRQRKSPRGKARKKKR